MLTNEIEVCLAYSGTMYPIKFNSLTARSSNGVKLKFQCYVFYKKNNIIKSGYIAITSITQFQINARTTILYDMHVN